MASRWRHIPTAEDMAYQRRQCELAESRGYFGYEWRTWKRIPRHVDKSQLEDRWIEIGLTDDTNKLLPPAPDTRRRVQVFKVPIWPSPNAIQEAVASELLAHEPMALPGATLRQLTGRIGGGGENQS